MSNFQTKIADNFIAEELLNPREDVSLRTPFMRRNMTYVVDQQNGNGTYTNGQVIIDSTSISASGNPIDWRNAYIAVPWQDKWDLVFTGAPGALTSNTTGGPAGVTKYALCPKNCSKLYSMKVECNGKVIVTATSELPKLTNFRLLTTMNETSLDKDAATINFYPDDPSQIEGTDASCYNTANDLLHKDTVYADTPLQANIGLVKRQSNYLPSNNTAFQDPTMLKNEARSVELGSNTFPTTTAAATPSDIHYLAFIRLKDICPYFDCHPIARGVSYRFTLTFNQAVSTVSHSAGTDWAYNTNSVSTTITSGTAQPVQFCCGIGSMLGRLVWTNSVAATSTITSKIDTTTDARFSGVRLYVPSYEFAPEFQEQVMASPVYKSSFIDYQYFQGTGAVPTNTYFNHQISTSCTNPRGLFICPRISSTSTVNNSNQITAWSPLTTSPSTPDPYMSLVNLQVKVGSQYLFPDRMYYTFQEFMEHLNTAFAANGNQSNVLSTGLITKKRFETIDRFYYIDLSRYPEAMKDLPQMIAVEGINNTKLTIDLEYFLLYGRSAEYNFAAGSVVIST